MADYTLEARVTADTSDFNAGMSGAAEALGDLGSQASRAGASAGKAGGGLSGFSAKCSALTGAVMGAAASITSNLVGGFGDLVSSAAEAADSTQKFASTLEFAGLGADEIEALSKSTRKYADQTVYSLSDIQNTTAQLAANGVKDYDRLAEAAGNLNAVAGGNADTFKSVGMVLTQTAGQGKLTTENFNQLADAIPGASGKIQQALADMGAYTGNFRDAMEEGQISAQEFNDAIMSLGFEDAAVKAATSTSTIEGAMGNLQATLEGGLADSITILTPAITNLANSISENLGPAFEVFNGFLQTFVDGMNAGKDPIQAFADAFVTLPEPVQQVATAIGALGAAFAAYKIASTFLGIAQGVQGLVSGFAGLGGSRRCRTGAHGRGCRGRRVRRGGSGNRGGNRHRIGRAGAARVAAPDDRVERRRRWSSHASDSGRCSRDVGRYSGMRRRARGHGSGDGRRNSVVRGVLARGRGCGARGFRVERPVQRAV